MSENYKIICHSGVKGMKWGYNFGKSNGRRTAEEIMLEAAEKHFGNAMSNAGSKEHDANGTGALMNDIFSSRKNHRNSGEWLMDSFTKMKNAGWRDDQIGAVMSYINEGLKDQGITINDLIDDAYADALNDGRLGDEEAAKKTLGDNYDRVSKKSASRKSSSTKSDTKTETKKTESKTTGKSYNIKSNQATKYQDKSKKK